MFQLQEINPILMLSDKNAVKFQRIVFYTEALRTYRPNIFVFRDISLSSFY